MHICSLILLIFMESCYACLALPTLFLFLLCYVGNKVGINFWYTYLCTPKISVKLAGQPNTKYSSYSSVSYYLLVILLVSLDPLPPSALRSLILPPHPQPNLFCLLDNSFTPLSCSLRPWGKSVTIQKVVELAPGELASIPKGQAPLLSFLWRWCLGLRS